MTPNIRERVLRKLEFVKNKRSWLDSIEYAHEINSGGIYIGGVATSAGTVVIDPSLKITIGPQVQNVYIGGVATTYQIIHV